MLSHKFVWTAINYCYIMSAIGLIRPQNLNTKSVHLLNLRGPNVLFLSQQGPIVTVLRKFRRKGSKKK